MELLVIIMAGVIVFLVYKNRKAARSRIDGMPLPPEHPERLSRTLDAEMNRFAFELRQEISLAEKYLQASYLEWRLAREREQRIYNQTGVMLPRTPTRERQDAAFIELERTMEGKRQLLLEHHRQTADEAARVADVERRTADVLAALKDDLK